MSPHFYRTVKEIYGYKNVHAFYSGFPTWQKTGRPIYTEPEFLDMMIKGDGAFILVDLREPEAAAREHIPGAVNYPMSELHELYSDLPKDKNARIIYYSDNDADAQKAHRTIRINGYNRGYILNGGIKTWKDKGYKVAHNNLQDEIKYQYKLLPGVIGDKEFREVAAGSHSDKVILDVRSAGEIVKGQIAGSINIPIDTLDKRWSELPKDKEYLAQCSGGNRARMAYMILKDHGYKARYIDAKVKVNKDGSIKSIKMRKN